MPAAKHQPHHAAITPGGHTTTAAATAAEAAGLPKPPSIHNQPNGTRLANWTHWWHYASYDCDSGVEEGTCDGVEEHCKAKCLADAHCGGFNSDKHLKHLDCARKMKPYQHHGNPDPSFELWVLRVCVLLL